MTPRCDSTAWHDVAAVVSLPPPAHHLVHLVLHIKPQLLHRPLGEGLHGAPVMARHHLPPPGVVVKAAGRGRHSDAARGTSLFSTVTHRNAQLPPLKHYAECMCLSRANTHQARRTTDIHAPVVHLGRCCNATVQTHLSGRSRVHLLRLECRKNTLPPSSRCTMVLVANRGSQSRRPPLRSSHRARRRPGGQGVTQVFCGHSALGVLSRVREGIETHISSTSPLTQGLSGA